MNLRNFFYQNALIVVCVWEKTKPSVFKSVFQALTYYVHYKNRHNKRDNTRVARSKSG